MPVATPYVTALSRMRRPKFPEDVWRGMEVWTCGSWDFARPHVHTFYFPTSPAVLTPEIADLLDAAHLGFVATMAADGTPRVSPKGTVAVLDAHHLVFVDFASPGTVARIAAQPAVEVCVVDAFARRGYRFRGTAEVTEDPARLADIAALYRRRRNAESRVERAVVICVDAVEAVWSPSYSWGETEADLRAAHGAAYAASNAEALKRLRGMDSA